MMCLLEQLSGMRKLQWREGLIINLFKKGVMEDPGNYRAITLLSVVGKVFCKVLNNRLVHCLDKEGVLHEGQAGFRVNRSCRCGSGGGGGGGDAGPIPPPPLLPLLARGLRETTQSAASLGCLTYARS